ncbi:Midasin [Bienertia sinuspersici]
MTWKVATSKKGQRSPPPLPMYERVVLKHVPTMVRRRYDRDLNVIDENNEGRSEDDEVEDLDDSFDDNKIYNEAEDDTHANLNTEHDSQSCTEISSINNMEPSSSMLSDDSISKDAEDDETLYLNKCPIGPEPLSGSCSKDCEDVDLVRYMDANVENKVHENELGSQSKGKGAEDANERKDDDDGAEDASVAKYIYTSVGNEVQDNEQGFHEEDNKNKGDGAEDESVSSNCKDVSVQDEVQGNQHGTFDNKLGMT